jgi:hypothetical protein
MGAMGALVVASGVNLVRLVAELRVLLLSFQVFYCCNWQVFPYAMGKVVDDVMPPTRYVDAINKSTNEKSANSTADSKCATNDTTSLQDTRTENRHEVQNEPKQGFPFEALAALFVVGAAASFLRVTLLNVVSVWFGNILKRAIRSSRTKALSFSWDV